MNSRQTPPGDLPVLVLIGPTAIGKTALSLELAGRYNCEIVSVDSMQVYRYMDIGTAKASPAERAEVLHHLIDIIDPDEQYDAARFVQDAGAAIALIHEKGKLPLLTGGTGLYLKALLSGLFSTLPIDPDVRDTLKKRMGHEGLGALHRELTLHDPLSAQKIHFNDEQRILRALEILYATGIPWSRHLELQTEETGKGILQNMLQIGLTCNRENLYDRINERCRKMINDGLEQEVHALMAKGYGKELKSLNAIGYRHMINYMEGVWSSEETCEILARDTRRYAKRQYTWFNKMPDIEWYESTALPQILERVNQWLG
ncbi:MAG: tRNA (adenosine(37)-N6)-dimethylallyltransferase MiaA [Desulfoprunum sp.]|nr:tRNA (adenosine(37)-N6)-dimethylallyltransferase MiaA [Desulfoprunum sp.]